MHFSEYLPPSFQHGRFFEAVWGIITKIKTNMKNKLMPLIDKMLLRKRSIIETSTIN